MTSCGGASPSYSDPSPPVYGFRVANGGSTDLIAVGGAVRCYRAANSLYVSVPNTYPSPSNERVKVINLIVGRFHGSGDYKITESTDDPDSVILFLLDYAGPNDYSIVGHGQTGTVRIKSSSEDVTGHVDGTMRGLVDSVQGDWKCHVSAAPSGSVSVTALPSPP